MREKSICLNMIVKNEKNVIQRSLNSIKKKIDYWVIVDTGSTDGTQETIREFMKDLPGELHERPWVNFEHNRNEALALARNKGDYVLFIDADEEWVITKDFDKSKLEDDFYTVKIRDHNVDLHRIVLIKNDPEWFWQGVLHEEIRCQKKASGEKLEGITNYGLPRDGNRAKDPLRYKKDAEILEKEFQINPTPRYAFYLAQSYGAANDFASSLKYYEIRAKMGGFKDEVFWSLFCIGCLQEELKYDSNTIIQSYCKAYEFDQSRAEPLHHLANFYHINHNHFLGYLTAKEGLSLTAPETLTYVLREIYDYSLLIKFACCAHFIGRLDEAKASYDKILSNSLVPERYRKLIEINLNLLNKKLDHLSLH